MKYLIFIFAFVSLMHLAFAAPDSVLTTDTPCDAPVAAVSDPSIQHTPELQDPNQPPVTMDNGFADGSPSVAFPIETPLGELQTVPGKYHDSRVPVGSVTVDGHGTSMNILNLRPAAPQTQTPGGCAHLNGK